MAISQVQCQISLHVPESRLSMSGKDVCYPAVAALLDQLISIDKGCPKPRCQGPTYGAFAGAHKAGKNDVGL
jgi:hypothetical protein